jgi:hypothetical protein
MKCPEAPFLQVLECAGVDRLDALDGICEQAVGVLAVDPRELESLASQEAAHPARIR